MRPGPDGGPVGDAAMTRVLTLAELSALPAVTDLVTAGRASGWAGPRPTSSPGTASSPAR